MPFFKIAHTYTERKNIVKFWEEARNEAEKIYDDYTNDKDNKFHYQFYKRIFLKEEDIQNRPDFFEPIYSKK